MHELLAHNMNSQVAYDDDGLSFIDSVHVFSVQKCRFRDYILSFKCYMNTEINLESDDCFVCFEKKKIMFFISQIKILLFWFSKIKMKFQKENP